MSARWGAACLAASLLSACPSPKDEALRVGLDAALAEVGLGAWLEARFERDTGARARLTRASPAALAAQVREGRLDEVLLGSAEAVAQLLEAGLLAESETIAHEELILVGPRENLLGKYAHTEGAELLRNVARTNHRYLLPAPGSVEGLRHRRLFAETGDHVQPGAWFATRLQGAALARAAVARDAFALVRRSALLEVAREGRFPGRVWAEGDPELVVEIVAGRVHPERTGRGARGAFHAWLTGPEGAAALEGFGADRFGHPLFAPGAPRPGEGASAGPLQDFVRARVEAEAIEGRAPDDPER